jgi:carboxyl-terminal processing protease
VRRGWILRSLDGWEVPTDAASDPDEEPREARFEARVRTLRRTSGPVGSEVEAVFLDDRDRPVTVELVRAKRDVIAHSFGTQLPTFYLRFHSETYERDGRRLGLIHFSNWFLPMAPRIDAAVDAMRDYDGIVIDLRGNSGGAGVMVMGTSGHFFADRRELGRMQTRVSTMTFRANPRLVNAEKRRVRVFEGPLAILVDETSASASEMFSGCMQDTGRARVFGETTAGAVLPAKTTALPDGDALLHAFADFVTVRGTRLEHRGVIPDELVPVDRERLLAGADAPVEAALSWLARTAGAPTAGE